MLSRELKKDRILILWNSRYYVVNKITYDLLDMFDKNYSVSDISKRVGYSKKEVKELYKIIEEKLITKDFYEDNLLLKTPIKIQWKITNKCNLHCKHCYLGKLNGQELEINETMKIVDNIINSNVMEVTLSGGECLTYKGIDEIVKRLLENGIKVDIFTNAILLDSFIEKLNNFSFNKSNILFYVSVDGLKKTHEIIRGKNTFDRTIENIKYAIKNGYSVVTNTVINVINYDDIIDMIILLKKLGVKDVQLSNLIIQGNASNDLKVDLIKQKELKSKLSKLYNDYPELGYIYYSEVPDEDGLRKVYSIQQGEETYIGNDNWKCTAGLARATIDSYGKVYCCPFINDSYLGDLHNDKLPKIWDNINRFKFLERLAKENTDRVCLAIKQGKKGDGND